LAATATAVANARPQYGLPPLNSNNNRVIPDPSTLVNQYQMMPPNPQQNNNLPGLQLPGLPPTRPNLPQNDGANDDDDHLTTEVYLECSFWDCPPPFFFVLTCICYRKLISVLRI
jgi:hypothetical protein